MIQKAVMGTRGSGSWGSPGGPGISHPVQRSPAKQPGTGIPADPAGAPGVKLVLLFPSGLASQPSGGEGQCGKGTGWPGTQQEGCSGGRRLQTGGGGVQGRGGAHLRRGHSPWERKAGDRARLEDQMDTQVNETHSSAPRVNPSRVLDA